MLSSNCATFLAPVKAVLKYLNFMHQARASWARLQSSSSFAIFSISFNF
jgi:hypothetical protein